MRTKKYKILFLFVIVFTLRTFTNYAKGTSYYYEYNSNSGSVSEYKEYVNLSDLMFNIEDSNVNFTQDSEYYYFDITQSFTGRDEGYGFCLYHKFYNTTNFFIAPFSDINNVSYYNYIRLSSSSTKRENYLKLSGNIISDYESRSGSDSFNVITDTYKYNFICSQYTGPMGDQKSFKYINSYNIFKNSTNFTSHIEFGIKKENIENFRYFRFIFPFYWDRNTSTSGNNYLYSSGVTNYSIDLKDYINCSHDYKYVESNRDSHKKKCEYCKWEIVEEHNFLFTYDNIENNHCICGYNKTVRFILLNMRDEVIFEYSGNPNDLINYIDDKNQLGVDFLYYETYILNDDEWVKSENCDKVIDILINQSVKFVKIVSVHKYNLVFNRENSLNLQVNGDMSVQNINCGESVKINKCKFFVAGYSFAGWGIKPNISEVMFSDEEIVTDLSYEDNKNINLYPIFSPLIFEVKYHYRERDFVKTINYTYDKVENLEEFNLYLDNDRTFIGWEYNGEILNSENTKVFNSYVEKNIKNFDLYAYIQTPFNGSERTNNTENSPNKKIVLDNINSDDAKRSDKNENNSSKNLVVNGKENDEFGNKKDNKQSLKENVENFITKILKLNELLDYEVLDKENMQDNIDENSSKNNISVKNKNVLYLNIIKIFEKFKNVEIIVFFKIIFYLISFLIINLIVIFILLLIREVIKNSESDN